MTKILTVRLSPDLHDKAEARATRLGLDRAKYVRSLIENDILEDDEEAPRSFASEDLVGLYQIAPVAATNASVRERLRSQALGRK